MLDKESSQRLALLRFPLIVLVVFAHVYEKNVNMAGHVVGLTQISPVVGFVREYISNDVARIATPLFFLMSGYLFFLNFDGSKAQYRNKLRSRFKTLFVPFVFWNCATLLLITIAQTLPEVSHFTSDKTLLVRDFNLFDFINVFGINKMPISYQFWFIRDLMILIVASPVIRFLCNYPTPLISISFLWWVSLLWPSSIPSPEAVLFFSCGAIAASTQRSLFLLDSIGKYSLFSYFPLIAVDVLLIGTPAGAVLHKTGIIVGVIGALFATKLVLNFPFLARRMALLSGASFFVFAAHEPLLTIARKVAYSVLKPETPMIVLSLYWLIPIVLIAALVVIHRYSLLVAPAFIRVIAGRAPKAEGA